MNNFGRNIYRIALGLVMMLKIALVGWWPTYARMFEEGDSALFIRQSTALLQGNWLGSYDYMTLMKGPMTPLWIALTNLLSWPTNFAREILYLATCLLAVKALSFLCGRYWVLFLCFSFLVFFPAASSYAPLAALYREAIHLPLVLGVESLLMLLFVKYAQAKRVHWHETILLGIFLLAFFLNREETPWIFPQLVWLTFGLFGILWWRHRHTNLPSQWADILKILLVPVLIVSAGVEWISQKNLSEYGVDAVLEINRPEFKAAYTGMLRIKPDKSIVSAHLTPETFKKLTSLPLGSELNQPPLASDKTIHAMFLPWYFRASTQSAGYYEVNGGAAVLAFYQALGNELALACETQRFECRPVLFGSIPISDGFWAKLFPTMRSNFFEILRLEGISPSPGEFDSFADYYYKRNLSLLTSAPIALAKEDMVSLPGSFVKWARSKTLLLEDIRNFYVKMFPTMCYLALMIFIIAMAKCLRHKTIDSIEFVMFGLFGALFTQVVIYALLWTSELSAATRMYYNSYPVLALFIAITYIYFGKWLMGRFKRSNSAIS